MSELETAAISRRLQDARKQAGLTQQEMADLLVVHKRSVEDYESPRKDVIPYDRLNEWARLTKTTAEWLLHGIEPGEAATPGQVRDLDARLARVEELQAQQGALLEANRVVLEEIRALLAARNS